MLECVGPLNRNEKKYIDYWEKGGMTKEGRLQDWQQCGGQASGNFGYEDSKRLPDEDQHMFDERMEFEFQRCMLRAGYHWTGQCSSDWGWRQPMCGAP